MLSNTVERIFVEWIESELQASAAGYPEAMSDSSIFNIVDSVLYDLYYPCTMEEVLRTYKVI